MKSEALMLVENILDPAQKLNLLREYLQAFVLQSLHEAKAFQSLSFVGGTSLRFLFSLPRFSEDLDFSLEKQKKYSLRNWLAKIKRDLGFANFSVEITLNDRKPVHVAWVRTSGLLKEAGLAALPAQKLSIKLEIDTRPPAGAVLENTLVNRAFSGTTLENAIISRHLLFAVQHHDLPSLLAGKIHALSARRFLKGRDWYDLLWFRSLRQPRLEPNLELLQNALDQTREGWNARDWKDMLAVKLESLNMDRLLADVAPFLERQSDAALLTKEYIRQVLRT